MGGVEDEDEVEDEGEGEGFTGLAIEINEFV